MYKAEKKTKIKQTNNIIQQNLPITDQLNAKIDRFVQCLQVVHCQNRFNFAFEEFGDLFWSTSDVRGRIQDRIQIVDYGGKIRIGPDTVKEIVFFAVDFHLIARFLA